MKDVKDKLSIFISLILRHKPEAINIKLDRFGYAYVDELIAGINKSGKHTIDFEKLKNIVNEDKKGRYSFSDDFTKIRANQGHSIRVDVELKEAIPPNTLYHGTATRNLENILSSGIKKMSRLYVHLSDNIETASQVGKRHGSPIILKVDAKKMHKDGYKFYISENKVWLTDTVPSLYVETL